MKVRPDGCKPKNMLPDAEIDQNFADQHQGTCPKENITQCHQCLSPPVAMIPRFENRYTAKDGDNRSEEARSADRKLGMEALRRVLSAY